MDDLLQEFLTESNEHLDMLDRELVRFEQSPNDHDTLRHIFRVVHTIKGTCGFLNLPRLEALAHAAETLMGQFRDGASVRPEAVTLILATLDRIKLIMAVLGQSGAEPVGSDTDLISALEGMAKSSPARTEGALVYQVLDRPLREGEVSLDELERAFRETEAEPSGPAFEAPAIPAATPAASAASEEAAHEIRIPTAQTLRVNVDTLEHLMTMVSELVLTRNQLLEISRHSDDAEYKVPLQRLSHITAELQDSVMKTRMQPIGNAWTKLPRIVRDLSHELGKKIDFVTEGADTELDRQVLELIKDPLTHMVRNSSDHGIELPEVRRAQGKPETGTIRLSAAHEGGTITIRISDDGRGLDLARISRKALERGLVSEAELERMTDAQIVRFIFHPGFSTADHVTNVSGRGVGMDVVKSNVDTIGGTIDVTTREGEGSTFIVKIPLTLAIVQALIVSARDQRFCIPQLVVRELVRVGESADIRIERINGAPVMRLRDRLLPIVSLGNLLELGKETEESGFVVVTQVGGRQFGILVDGVFHTEEIVVKPMSGKLRHLSLFSGNTILGDGSVVLILEPNGVSRMIATVTGEAEEQTLEALAKAGTAEDRISMLVFRAGSDRPKALPLSVVTRLEDVDASTIEYGSGVPVLQYRGRLMPIVAANEDVVLRREGFQPLIIFSDGDRCMGLAVDAIIDIVEDRLDIELPSTEDEGIIGSAVVRGRATEVVDVAHFLPQAYPDWLQAPRRTAQQADAGLLLVESSDFFREMLAPVLRAAGFTVTAAANADSAQRAFATQGFKAILIDLDAADGLALAASPSFQAGAANALLIGRATYASADLIEAARSCGINEIVAKFDRRALLAALTRMHSDARAAA